MAVSSSKKALGVVQERLASLGFKKRRAGIFSSVISDDVVGWVGLNMATGGRGGALELNPVVGVRNLQIERIVAELTEIAFDELVPPTIAGNVGYLSPGHKYLAFIFNDKPSDEDEADRLCEAIKMFGVPFMMKVADVRFLVEAMQQGQVGITEQLNYRIPVALWLLNRNEEAKAFLAAKIAETGTRSDPAANRYRSFAEGLISRVVGGGGVNPRFSGA